MISREESLLKNLPRKHPPRNRLDQPYGRAIIHILFEVIAWKKRAEYETVLPDTGPLSRVMTPMFWTPYSPDSAAKKEDVRGLEKYTLKLAKLGLKLKPVLQRGWLKSDSPVYENVILVIPFINNRD